MVKIKLRVPDVAPNGAPIAQRADVVHPWRSRSVKLSLEVLAGNGMAMRLVGIEQFEYYYDHSICCNAGLP